jgi:hypothetical protein
MGGRRGMGIAYGWATSPTEVPMTIPISALFADRHSAHAAVEQLAQAGFGRDDLTVAMSEDAYEREFGAGSGRSSGIRPAPYSGGVLPAIVAGLKSLGVAGSGPLRAGGPLLDPLLRERSLSAALAELGIDTREAQAISDALRSGQIVVGAHASGERMTEARQLLELAGGELTRAA